MKRYTIQRESGDKSKIVATDHINNITCTFVPGDFENTAHWTAPLGDPSEIAALSRELATWLFDEHPELILIDMADEVAKMRKVYGAEVAACRAAAGMDLRECAAAIGISKNHLINIEHGRYAVTIDIMTKIAHVLDMDFVIATEYDQDGDDDEDNDFSLDYLRKNN